MYDLAVDGASDFYVRRPGAKRLIRREPLVGIADGLNLEFLTSHSPFLYASFYAHVGASLYNSSQVTLDADGGVVTFAAAPTTPPTADYTAVPLTNRQVIYFAWAGFALLESMWSRGFLLSNSLASYQMASAEDDHIYIVTQANGVVADPVCGSLTFSTSPRQRALLVRAIELAYLDSLAFESAASDLNIRERAGGIAVDALGRPKNLLALREAAYQEMWRILQTAMDEYYPDGDNYGALANVPHTSEYEQIWHWQTNGAGLVVPMMTHF